MTSHSDDRPPAVPTVVPGLGAAVRALRPKQWRKNVVLYAGFLFTLNEKWRPFSPAMFDCLLRATLAFLLFCLLSSTVYLINDLKDIDQDRLHPVKRHRPLASGALSPATAVILAVILGAAALSGSYALGPLFFSIGLSYLIMQILYTFALKHVVILDVFIIALGFVMRAISGAAAIGAEISPWLYIVTLLGALFLGLSKRRHELVLLGDDAGHHRRILREYNTQLLDQLISIVASATIMAYSLYTFTSPKLPQSHQMMLTIPFVIYGMFRYLYLVYQKHGGGSPEDLLFRDRPLLAAILLWSGTAAAILALSR